jgi:hypothetical protein
MAQPVKPETLALIQPTTHRFAKKLAHIPFDIVGLALFPFVMMLANDFWTYLQPTVWIDPFIYTGYMLDLRDYIRDFGPTYYGSRLPWLIVGSVFHSLFSFELANLLLRLVLFYCAVFSMYFALRGAFFDKSTALIGALFLGTNSYFLWSITWDYPDGVGIALLSLTLALVTASAMTMVSCQLFLLALMPSIGLYSLIVMREAGIRQIALAVLFSAVGSLVAFAGWGVISLYLGGQFNYLQPQIDAAQSLSAAAYERGDTTWIIQAGWLVLPTLGVLVSIFILGRLAALLTHGTKLRDLDQVSNVSMAVAVAMLSSSMVFLYLEFTGGAELQFQYYADYLFPFACLVIGAAIALALSQVTPNRKPFIVGCAAVILVAPLATDGLLIIDRFPMGGTLTNGWGFLAALGIVLLMAAAVTRRYQLLLVALVPLAMVSPGTFFFDTIYDFHLRETMKNRFVLMAQANDALEVHNRNGNLRFWYDANEPLGGVYRGVSSLHLWLFRLVGEDFPKRTFPYDGSISALHPGDRIAIFSMNRSAFELAQQSVANEPVSVELLSSFELQKGRNAFNVYVIRVVPRGLDNPEAVPLRVLGADGRPVGANSSGAVHVETIKQPYAYAATLQLRPDGAVGDGPAIVKVVLSVERGTVGVGVLNKAQDGFVDRLPALKSPESQELYLTIPSLVDTSHIVFQSWDKGEGSRALVESVTLYLA